MASEKGPSGGSWLRGLFGGRRDTAPKAPSVPRESSADILARTRLPDREVALADINIRRLPINDAALRALGVAMNRLQPTPLDGFDIRRQLATQVTPELYDGIPLVSSAIAHHYNPNIPILTPNEAEVQALKPMLQMVAEILRSISQKWAARFGKYIEREAAVIITDTAEKVCTVVDGLGAVANPRAQFVREIGGVYTTVATPQFETSEDVFDILGGLFGDEEEGGTQVEVKIEQKIERLMADMSRVQEGRRPKILEQQLYPLLTWLLRRVGPVPEGMDREMMAIAAGEMMQGVETFLKQQGVRGIPAAPAPSPGFDLFDPDTWLEGDIMRTLAEWIKPELLEKVKRELPGILTAAKEVMPSSGPEVLRAVQTLAEDILILKQRGATGEQIAKALLGKA